MAGEWIDTTIGAQATLQRGMDITKVEQRPGTVPVFSSGGLSSYHDMPAAQGPGVILGRKGVVGSVYFVATDYWPHDTTLWVKDFHGNFPRFVYYFFRWMAPRIATMDVGSANPTLNRNHVHPIEIRWPPVSAQRAIARVLGALDDKIEENRRMNETLEETARAIFKSWFVDFDPVRAKAESRRPEGMDDETVALFPDGFEESEIGEVPKGWEAKPISEVAEINAWTLKTSDDLDRIEYIEISSVDRGEVHKFETYARGAEPSRARRRLRHGDTALSTVRPERMAFFLCLWPSENLIASTGFAVVTPSKVPWGLLHAALTDPDVFDDLGHLADGGAYPAVRPEVIGSRLIVLPEDDRLPKAFHAKAAPLYERANRNREESRTLAALRDALLPKLISGDLRVPVAGRIVQGTIP